MKHFALILFFAATAQAQLFSTKASRLASGAGAPASGDCAGDSDVDRVYVQKGSTTSDFRCRKTGASTYTWVDVTSGGGGSGGTDALSSGNCAPSKVSSTVGRISTACVVGTGSPYTLPGNADFTIGTSPSGSSTVYVWATQAGVVVAQASSGGATLSCNANCTVNGANVTSWASAETAAGTPFITRIATFVYTSSVLANPTDARVLLGTAEVVAGPGGGVTVTKNAQGQVQIDSSSGGDCGTWKAYPVGSIGPTGSGVTYPSSGWVMPSSGGSLALYGNSPVGFVPTVDPSGWLYQTMVIPSCYNSTSVRVAYTLVIPSAASGTSIMETRATCFTNGQRAFDQTPGTTLSTTSPSMTGGSNGFMYAFAGSANLSMPVGCTAGSFVEFAWRQNGGTAAPTVGLQELRIKF